MRFANAILRVAGRCIPLFLLRKRADKVARRFDHFVNMKFGKIDAQVACRYNEMCRMIFGNHMKLPPKRTRVPHLGRVLITSDLYVL